MAEAFDIGPLSWVKDEIDQSLKKAQDSFTHVLATPSEVASLRFTTAHLYQVSGALDMVGLEGCKRYCSEIEKVTSKLEKQQIPVNEFVMTALMQAVDVLSKYLQDLLNGMQDTSTRLYESLKPLVELQGESLDISDLFYPDTSYSAPKDLPMNPIAETAVPIFVVEQRVVYQKALLDWLRAKDESSLNLMQKAVLNVQQVQQKKPLKTLWWAATAFTEALAQDAIAQQSGAKKLCSRLDQQLRSMSLGDAKAPSQLLRNVLYYVAVSDSKTDNIAQVKSLFELDYLLPAAEQGTGIATATELAALAQINADLPTLKDLWTAISIASDVTGLEAFASKLDHLTMILLNLHHQKILKLMNAVQALVKAIQAGQQTLNESVLIEVAAALNLLELVGAHYPQLDAEIEQKIVTQTARLHAIVSGAALAPAVEAFATAKLDPSVTEAVAKQIIAALQLAEKSLDTYFRNPSNIAVLDDAAKPLQQVTAAFDMLEMPVPKAIAQHASAYVERFKTNAGQASNSAQFELLAESLSLLGLFAEELPNVRAASEMALSNALARLTQGTQAWFLTVTTDEAPVVQSEQSKHLHLTVNSGETLGGSLSYLKPRFLHAAINSGETLGTQLSKPAADKPVIKTEVATLKSQQAKVTDKASDAELLEIFLTEAEELLANLAQHLQTLRVNATNSEALMGVRRAYHTLKGSGRAVGLASMSEVAWSVEKLLNLVMERNTFPTPKQLVFVEHVSAEFATWVAALQAKQAVVLDPHIFQQRAAELESELEQDLIVAKKKPQKEEVLIGGTRKLSKAFFNIFLAEAQQHLDVLAEAQKVLVEESRDLPTTPSCRAAHTLSSNALTAGFKPIGDLARALEHWLDAHTGAWAAQHIALYGNVVNALTEGLEKAKALKNPKSTRALINALNKSTVAMQAMATQQAAAALEHQVEANLTNVAMPEAAEKTVEPVNVEEAAHTLQTVQSAQEVIANAEVATTNMSPRLPQGLGSKGVGVDQELLDLFVEEARELVPQIDLDLRGWRDNPHESEFSDALQRALHTLKGSARMAGQSEIGDSVHKMEDRVIHALRNKATVEEFDQIFSEFDRVSYMLEDIAGGVKVTAQDEDAAATVAKTTRSVERKSQFLRMRADVLDRLINEAGEVSIMRSRMDREMQNFKQSSTDLTDSIGRMRGYLRELEIEAETQMQSRMTLLQEANETFDPLEFDRFTRLQELARMLAESVNDVATIQHGLLLNLDQTDAALQQQNRMNRELQQGLMGVRMLPFATISERLQRIVRQTARELNKRVEMHIEGENIEVDRGVLDKMGAPLEHLLRNAVAHGLESTEERKKLGKSELGQIKLKVSLENDEITLVITDDGAGINLAKVKQKAIEKGIFSADQALSDPALMAVIFEPGFSTADTVSQIAGRGVGLDAVRSDIAALSGRIDVSNVAGTGAMFNIYLPVTLSVAQVVMARVGDKVFAIPSVMVEQVQKLKSSDLIAAYQAHQVNWANREYPLHYLSRLIGDADQVPQQHTYSPVVLLRSGTYRTALHVDEILGNQEVVMKQIGTQLARVPGMIGATVLGDGEIVLVINPVQLAYREALSVGAIKVNAAIPVVEQARKVALIVDDSLTMRKVLARVLEREDFEVITANDGIDAIQKLQLHTPDIILTDIEMPRMDGFEFSRHVRDNVKTSKTPLIMISSRTAEKHRNVAKELGVNAFLGKPVQDDELMEQVNALLKT